MDVAKTPKAALKYILLSACDNNLSYVWVKGLKTSKLNKITPNHVSKSAVVWWDKFQKYRMPKDGGGSIMHYGCFSSATIRVLIKVEGIINNIQQNSLTKRWSMFLKDLARDQA